MSGPVEPVVHTCDRTPHGPGCVETGECPHAHTRNWSDLDPEARAAIRRELAKVSCLCGADPERVRRLARLLLPHGSPS